MPRVTKKDASAYRVVIVYRETDGSEVSLFYGPHMSIVQARMIRTREARGWDRRFPNRLLDAYIERAGDWTRVGEEERR